MALTLSKSDRVAIEVMLDNGENNGRISLKYPGILKKQIIKIRNELNNATPQTKAKLKSDPLLKLYNNKSINSDDLFAAEYIRYAYSLITAGLIIRGMRFEGFVDSFGGKQTESEGQLQSRLQNQYSHWFDRCTSERIRTGPLIHILSEPVTLRDTDRYYGYRNGTTRKYVIDGLKLYVKMFKPKKMLDL